MINLGFVSEKYLGAFLGEIFHQNIGVASKMHLEAIVAKFWD